jgi:hypothetical protein
MCGLCFRKVAAEELFEENGVKLNLCKECASKEERMSLEEAVMQYNKAREGVQRAGRELHQVVSPRIPKCQTAEECDALRSMVPASGVHANRLHNLIMRRRTLLKREGLAAGC